MTLSLKSMSGLLLPQRHIECEMQAAMPHMHVGLRRLLEMIICCTAHHQSGRLYTYSSALSVLVMT